MPEAQVADAGPLAEIPRNLGSSKRRSRRSPGCTASRSSNSVGSVHSARRAAHHPGGFRGPAGSAALPDPQAQPRRAGHSDGAAHCAVHGLCRDHAGASARARRRIPADGCAADRDQVAHVASAAPRRKRRGDRPARRTGPPAAGIRADEEGREEAGRVAAAGPRFHCWCARGSRSGRPCGFPASTRRICAMPGWA